MAGAWQEAARSGISFEAWLQSWASKSGYWYPELLLDHRGDWATARRVRVAKSPRPIQPGRGSVVTHLSIGESAHGECQALLDAIARSIEKKTAKRQMDGAPDLRWLAVMLDGNAAAWQLNDIFGPDAQVPSPDFGDITLEYFDDVWVVAKAPHEESYVVLRLFKSGAEPRSAIVPRCSCRIEHQRGARAERQLRDDSAVAIPQAAYDGVPQGATHQHPVQQHHHRPVAAGVGIHEAGGRRPLELHQWTLPRCRRVATDLLGYPRAWRREQRRLARDRLSAPEES